MDLESESRQGLVDHHHFSITNGPLMTRHKFEWDDVQGRSGFFAGATHMHGYL